jgi:putative peptidoglycan lipid II flippase
MLQKIRNINSHISGTVAGAAFLITAFGIFSRILGLFRDRMLASTYGAGDVLDVYYAAFRIPDLIYNLLILGALSSAFIPVFTGLISNNKEEEAWKLTNGIMNLMLLAVAFFSLVFFIFTPVLMKIITPGFGPEKMEQVIFFTRIMFLSPFFLGIGGIFGGVLTSHKRFLIYSLAPIFYNLGIIFGILVFARFWGPTGLAWGVVFGAFLHMLVQYGSVRQLGFRHAWSLRVHLYNREVKRVLHLMIPRTFGIAVNQINLFVITIFASMLSSGSLAIFSFAQNLQSVPLGIVGVSFAIAVFPALSAFHSKAEDQKFIESFSETFRQILFFIIPISVFMILLRAETVRVVLGAGEFDWEDTVLTFECLGIFALSLFAQCTVPLLARAFYAMHNTKTPVYIALASEAVNILAVIFLIGQFGILSLAMAFSAASIVQMILLFFFLRRKLEHLDDRRILVSVGKIVVATFFAAIAVQLSKNLMAVLVNLDTFLGVFSRLLVSSMAGLAVFVVLCQIMKVEEFVNFKKTLYRKIFGGKKTPLEEDASEISGM